MLRTTTTRSNTLKLIEANSIDQEEEEEDDDESEEEDAVVYNSSRFKNLQLINNSPIINPQSTNHSTLSSLPLPITTTTPLPLPPIQISSEMQSSSSDQLLLSTGNRSKRNSHQSSATSFENENKQLSPRQRQLTSESSSCPSDNEISSLYGKYRHSAYSINETYDQHQQDQTENSRQDSFTQGDDADGLTVRKSGVIDELNWMLGQAIDSAQTDLRNSQELSPEHQDQQFSNISSSYPPLVTRLERLSIDKERNLHTPDAIQPGEHSIEDLSEPITASSLSDYSADPAEDLQNTTKVQQQRRRVYNLLDSGSSRMMEDRMKEYSAYDLTALSKSQDESLPQARSKIDLSLNKQYAESTISTGALSASSEEVLSTSALEDSHTQLLRRSPSQKHDPPIIGAINLQELVAARKQDALRETRQSTSSDHSQQIAPGPSSSPLQDSNTFNPLLRSNSQQKRMNISSTNKLLEEDQYRFPKSSSPSGRQLMARSPVVKRSSSDMSFLEQWQWLESQHPSSSSPKKKHSIQTDRRPSQVVPPTTREKCIETLDHHFRSSTGSIEWSTKIATLSQRQRNLEQALHRPNNANKSSNRTAKPVGAWFDRVPTINTKDLKKIKTTADRCLIYETKLQQLYSQPMGLDLWVWLKTCGESQSTLLPSHLQSRKPGYSPLMGHHQPPLSSLPPHLQQHQQSGNPHQAFSVPLSQIRDTSMSSVASFPLRAGNSQKAIQIRRGSDNQLVEIIHPDGAGARTNGMIVNSLMEVNNLPYPSLYPHSAGQHLGIQQAPAESHISSSATSSKMIVGSRSLLESSSTKGSAGGRFFSQITRHNSSKRRNNSASASSSPSKSNLVISAPLLAGPHSGPRGPRAEHNPFSAKTGAGPDLKALFIKTHDPSIGAPTRFSHDEESPSSSSPSTAPRGQHRMSFAYGSSSATRPPITPITLHTLPHRLAHQHHQLSASTGFRNVHPFKLPPPPSAPPLPLHSINPSILNHKLDKILDILPNADRNLLRKLLIDNQLDDVLTIGNYLELVKK